MALLAILTGIIVIGSLWALLKGHYIFAFGFILVGAYELTAPILFILAEDDVARQASVVFAEYASEGLMTSLVTGLYVFFATFTATYLLTPHFHHSGKELASFHYQHDRALFGFALVLLIFGL